MEIPIRKTAFCRCRLLFISYNLLQILVCNIRESLYFTLLFSVPGWVVGNVGAKKVIVFYYFFYRGFIFYLLHLLQKRKKKKRKSEKWLVFKENRGLKDVGDEDFQERPSPTIPYNLLHPVSCGRQEIVSHDYLKPHQSVLPGTYCIGLLCEKTYRVGSRKGCLVLIKARRNSTWKTMNALRSSR